ncbi:hypothetical protein ACX0G9_26495 [Flavitalea flava]
MNQTKWVFALGAVCFVLIGVYLQLTDSQVSGKYLTKYGQWQNSVLSDRALYFFAAIFGGIWVWLIGIDRKNRKNEE